MISTATTCVIPAFNREGTLGRAIQSALDQSAPPLEVIVVDDGSTDRTAAVAAGFGAPVRCVTQTNAGAATARDKGVREAHTPWIAFLDSDDYWTPGHLEAVGAAIRGTEGAADIYFANLRRPEEEGGLEQWQLARFSIPSPWQLKPDGQDWVLRPRIPMMLQSSVFQRERFLEKGGLWTDLRAREDTHCFLKHGVGHGLCAVNHLGAMMTADAAGGGRMMTQEGPKSGRYWECSRMIWSDLLDHFADLRGPGRALLKHRLFMAHWHLGRLALSAGRPLKLLTHAARALRTEPTLFARSLLGLRPSEEQIVPFRAGESGDQSPTTGTRNDQPSPPGQ